MFHILQVLGYAYSYCHQGQLMCLYAFVTCLTTFFIQYASLPSPIEYEYFFALRSRQPVNLTYLVVSMNVQGTHTWNYSCLFIFNETFIDAAPGDKVIKLLGFYEIHYILQCNMTKLYLRHIKETAHRQKHWKSTLAFSVKDNI